MSEEAIKRSYFKDDEEEKVKPAFDFIKSEIATPLNKPTQVCIPKEKMMEEEIPVAEISTLHTIHPHECILILESAKKTISSKKEKEKEKEKSSLKNSNKPAQTKKANPSALPTLKKPDEEPIQKPKTNEKPVASKEKSTEPVKQNKPKQISSKPTTTIKKIEEKSQEKDAGNQIQNELKSKIDKSKVKIENQDTIQTSELLASTKPTKKQPVPPAEKSENSSKPANQTKILASKVPSKLFS